jgi:hypothetical protein
MFLGPGYHQTSDGRFENQNWTLLKKDLDKQYGTVDLKSRFQQVWDKLNKVYNLYGLGWLKINPQRFRINNLFTLNDSLYIFLGLSAKPAISF